MLMVYPSRDGYVPVSLAAVNAGAAEIVAVGGRTAKRLCLAFVTQKTRNTPVRNVVWDPNAPYLERRLVDGVWTERVRHGNHVRRGHAFEKRPFGEPIFSAVPAGLIVAAQAALDAPDPSP